MNEREKLAHLQRFSGEMLLKVLTTDRAHFVHLGKFLEVRARIRKIAEAMR